MRRTAALLALALLATACGRPDSAAVTGLPSLPSTSTSTSTTSIATSSTTSTSSTTTTTLPPLQGVALELVADGFNQPVWAGFDPVAGEVIVLERPGRIRALDGEVRLDIDPRVGSRASEQGLLGIAFHPENPDLFYLNYTDTSGDTVVSEFRRSNGAMDPGSERMLLEVSQPASNHNGGNLAFGPDGMLYIGMGDGGASNDRFGNGQDPFTLLGSMLRLDPAPSADLPYTVPPDNPFVDGGADPLAFATGLRNPWRFTFDGDRLYVADVGQGEWEEVSVVAADAQEALNFGWPIQEGSECFQTGNCDPTGLVQPALEYSHAGGSCSITGGVVMHDPAIPELDGFYIYGDYCSGFVRGFFGPEASGQAELLRDAGQISHFGVDGTGAALVVALKGSVSRIVPVR